MKVLLVMAAQIAGLAVVVVLMAYGPWITQAMLVLVVLALIGAAIDGQWNG
jgi:hypothetical protein